MLTDLGTPELVRRARHAGVGLFSFGEFTRRRDGPAGVVLGYGGIQVGDIEPGLRRLREAVVG